MAYKREPIEITAGGVNLLAPPDKIPAGQSLVMKNWRTDAVGRMQTRNGHTAVTSAGSGSVHSLQRYRDYRYAGSGGTLYRNGSSVATGFDGSKLGLAAYGGRMWVMNRAKAGKDDGTNFYNWTPAAPASAPTLSAGSVTTIAVTSFDNTETWTILDPDGAATTAGTSSPGTFISAPDSVLGEALNLDIAAAGTYTATRVLGSTVNLSIGGQQRQEDVFRIHVQASDPGAIDRITFAVDVLNGDFETDYYTITVDSSDLRAWEWAKVRRKRARNTVTVENPQYVRLLEQARTAREAGDGVAADALEAEARTLAPSSSFDESGFERVGSTANKDWATVKAIRISVTANAACLIRFDQADFEGGATGSLNGTFQYWATFGNAAGEESNPSPASAEITVNGQSVIVTMPGTSDAQNTVAYLYRKSNLTRTALRVATSTPGGSVTDVTADTTAQASGILLRYDRTTAPLARYLVEFQGRLLAFGTAANPGRMFWTPVGEPWNFAPNDFIDVGDAAEEFLAITVHGNQVWMYKERTIHRLVGDPADSDPELVTAAYAPAGPWAVAEGVDVDYFATAGGVYLFNGDQVRTISDAVQPVFRDMHSTGSIPLDGTGAAKMALGFSQDLLYVSYAEAGNSANTATLAWNARKNEWFQDTRAFTIFHAEGPRREMTGGLSTGAVVAIDDGSTDSGSAIFAEWQSGDFDMGLPNNEKIAEDLRIEYLSPAALTVKIYQEDGTETTLGTLPIAAARSSAWFRLGTNGQGLRSHRFAVRVEGNVSGRAEIYQVQMHYYPEPRWALSFDSIISNAGTELAKRLHRLQLDINTTGSITLAIDGDSGASVAEIFTATITGTGRRTVDVSLEDSTLVTRALRIRLYSTTKFKVHDLSALVTPVPVFIRASSPWQTEEVRL